MYKDAGGLVVVPLVVVPPGFGAPPIVGAPFVFVCVRAAFLSPQLSFKTMDINPLKYLGELLFFGSVNPHPELSTSLFLC